MFGCIVVAYCLANCISSLHSGKVLYKLHLLLLLHNNLFFFVGLSFSEFRQSGVMLPDCTAPMPREMCFPVPKGQRWHDLYDYIR